LKEVPKDPTRDTLKELSKDPIRDTLKEAGKDPIRDTLKEAGKDPISDTIFERTGPQRPPAGDPSPYILETPSRAGGGYDMAADAAAQVQQLGEALAMLEQQQAELLAAYDEAVKTLDALQGGGQT
jgi:hypothetical protein